MNALHPDRLRCRWARIEPKLPPGITAPRHMGDCGYDLAAMAHIVINPGETVDIPINCRLELPAEYWAEMKPRSSIAKRGLQLDAGIIDQGYRGRLFVVMRTTNNAPAAIGAGERIAQLIFHRLHELWLQEVPEVAVESTTRGERGFGSTGY